MTSLEQNPREKFRQSVEVIQRQNMGHVLIRAMRGIQRDKGCMVVVRPDQYVAHVLPLDGFDALSEFFAGILL